jgi:hypothetical protein
MSKLIAVTLTAAICLPLGALLQGSASAERRLNGLFEDVAIRYRRHLVVNAPDGMGSVIGHPHLSRARSALHVALFEIEESLHDNEAVWTAVSGRASETREAIERAVQTIEHTATVVNGEVFANPFPAP